MLSRGPHYRHRRRPLGLASKPPGKPDADRCRAWVRTLDASGARIVVPEVADYEVRRELIRAGATARVRRLDRLEFVLDYDPITTAAMRRAAEFWAVARNAGLPTTAHGHALDADCILAAQALLLSGLGDVVTVATTNARHVARFPGLDAQPWETITG
jgi:predicted nucleic acid-binding protein